MRAPCITGALWLFGLVSCGPGAPSALTVTVEDGGGGPVFLARVEIDGPGGVDADLTGGEGISRFEGLASGRTLVSAALEPLCPSQAEVDLGPGQDGAVTLVLVDRLDLGPDLGQIGFGKTVDVTADVRCGRDPVSWELLEGDPALVSFDGPVANVQTMPLETVVDLDDRPGVVPVGPAASQRLRLRATVGSAGAADEIEVTAAPRAGGVFQVATGADLYLNGGATGPYSFELVDTPDGSASQLEDAASRTPRLRPDLFGTYRVRESVGGVEMDLEAGRYDEVPRDCGRVDCHPSEAEGFALTAHATTFDRALAGELGPSFDERCTLCHSVGSDPVVFMGGFDDVAAARGYEIEVPSDVTAVPSKVRVLANIWCTSCHGPGRIIPRDDSWEWGAKYSAGVCAQCHDGAPQAATRVAEWRRAKMSRFSLDPDDPAVQRGCARCHSAQGFVAWQRSGSVAALPDMRTAQPITCAACHDAHSSGRAQLRVAGGEEGSLALCATCHAAQASPEVPQDRDERRAPHAPQGEIVLEAGSPHSFADACAVCHMAGEDPLVGRHTFAMRDPERVPNGAACTGCHPGATDLDSFLALGDWDGDGAREAHVEEVDGLIDRLEDDVTNVANDLESDACGGREPAGVGESAGRIVLVDGAGLDLGDCNGDGRIGADESSAVLPADQGDLYEAAFALLEATRDGSHGLHDPVGQPRGLQRAITSFGRSPAPAWDRR
ncbi:MAG: hypothetical protein HYY06_16665 [Deltaproteobacteria bacterium]|nr:hypothetical protein [Deltaproteobacteria bacterium]